MGREVVVGSTCSCLDQALGRLEGHGAGVVEIVAANREKVRFVAGAADLVEEFSIAGNASSDEVQVAFHGVDVRVFQGISVPGFFPEFLDVMEDIAARGKRHGQPGAVLPDLLEEPGILDRSPADHEAAGPG